MCDFDIASFRNQSVKRLKRKKPKAKAKAKEKSKALETDTEDNTTNEFALRLQKRKLLGLDLSDSESNSSSSSSSDSETNKKGRKKKPKLEYQAFAKLMLSDSSDDDDKGKEEKKKNSKDTSSAAPDVAEEAEQKPEQQNVKEEKGPYIDPDLILLSDDDLAEVSPTTAAGRNGPYLPTTMRRPSTSIQPNHQHQHQQKQRQPSSEKKSLSPVIPALSVDELDPELAMLAASPETSLAPTESVGPRKVQIKVQFINLQTTNDPNLQAFIDNISKPVKVIVMDNEPFDVMLTHYCKRKLLKKEEMILVYQNVPVVLRATPASLNMLPDTKNIIYVYKKADYEKKIAQEEQEKEERFRRLAIDPTSAEFLGTYLPQEPQPAAEPEEEERMLIKLRGKDKHDVTLRVKKNTILRNVVKHYIQVRKLDVSMEDKISLSFEGEVLSLDDAIEDTELEDQDMVSVTIRS